MTADDAREELEAVIWRSGSRISAVAEILAAADAYAGALAAERLAGRERLAEVTAEAYGERP